MPDNRSRDRAARRRRGGLLATTALTAAILLRIDPIQAQPAPNARPQGGQVVGGSASISTTPSTTTIDQTTQRATINWNSFNVGSQQTVTFEQPSATSMTLNRVTSADPSAIAGHIDANGGIVITNPNGVVFYRGAEVNATDLVVSAPGISNRNFMAGHMVFNRPAKPGAAVVNRGDLTIRQAGLGALVAPQVRNRGTITAKLGHVALAGADAATLDMYGDGLVSIDVTRQVTHAPDGHEALVTNTGVIEANGGTVQLTASAADNVVTNLVAARGHIAAASVGSHTGTVAIEGTGGSLLVDGRVLAGGAQGGAFDVAGPGDVTVGHQARISASGTNGGGTIAIGTDLARADGGASVTPTVIARRTTIARGARISADARSQGNGGRVTLLSAEATVQNGRISARGGSLSGNGGLVEISSKGGIGLNGSVDVGAPHGNLGSILLDPGTLDIINAGTAFGDSFDASGTLFGDTPDAIGQLFVSDTAVDNLTGNIVLQATTLLVVDGAITLTRLGQALALQSAGNLTTNAPIQTNGNIDLEANSRNVIGGTPTGGGTVQLNASVTTTGGSVNVAGAIAEVGSFVFPGTIVAPITASGGITVAAPSYTQWNGTSLHAGGDVSISASAFMGIYGPIDSTGGSVNLNGGNVVLGYPGSNPPPAPITANGRIVVNAGAGGISQGPVSPLQAGGDISLFSTDPVSLNASVVSTGGAVSVTGGAGAGGNQSVSDAGPITAATSITVTTTGPDSDEGPALQTFFNGSLSAGGVIRINAGTATASLGDPITSSGGPVSITGAEVSIDALITLTGAGQKLTIQASDNVTTFASITTQGAITIAANSSVAGTPSGFGEVDLGAPVATSSGSVNLSGYLVSLGINGEGVSPGPVTAQAGTIGITAGAGGVFQTQGSPLQASGSVTIITPGPVTTNDLIASTGSGVTISGSTIGDGGVISANGNISLAGSGGVTIGPAVTSSAGNVSITSNSFVFINDPVTSGPGFEILVAAPTVDIFAQLTVPGNLPTRQLGGPTNVLVQADTLALTSTINTVPIYGSIVAPGGIIAFTPYTPGNPLTVDNSGLVSTGPVLTTTELGLVQTNGLVGGTPVTGSLFVGGAGSGTPAVAGSTTLNVSTDISAIASTLGLFATGLVTETNGAVITAGTLVGAANSAALNNGNSIGNLGSFTSSSGFSLVDTAPLAIIGPVTDTTSITLTDTGGAITEAQGGGGSLTTAQLTGSTPSSGQFVNTNTVSGLGSFSAPGGFALTNTGPLTVSGPVTGGPSIVITDTGAVTLTGPLTATSVGLTATGNPLTEAGAGLISAGTLTGSAGSANLGNANTIATLDGFTTSSGFLLNDAIGLDIAGTLSDPTTVTLTIAGPLTESTGVVNAGVLAGSATSANLGGSNAIVALGTFSTINGLLLKDTTGLDIAGRVSDPTTITLTIAGALTESTGAISTGTLTGTAASANLGNANTLATLADFTTTGGFLLNNTAALDIAGTVSDPTSVTLNVAGPLTESTGVIDAGALAGRATSATLSASNGIISLGTFTTTSGLLLNDTTGLDIAGRVSDPTSVTLTIAGALTESTGAISTGTLTGAAASANLGNANTLTTLGDFTTTRGFLLADATSLDIAGTVRDPTSVTLNVAGPLTESTGVIDAGTLAGSATSATLGNANTVASLGTFTTTAGLLLNDTTGLQIAGTVSDPNSVTLIVAGPLTESTGLINTGTLSGSATDADLGNANAIATLGSFSDPNVFFFNDTQSVLVSGPVDPNTVGIVDAGSITLAGNVTAAIVALTAQGGSITQTSGVLTAGLLNGDVATGAQFGTNASSVDFIGTLGRFIVGSGSLTLIDNEPLIVAGPLSAPSFHVQAPGQITLSGATIATTGVPLSAQGGNTPAVPGSDFQVTPINGSGSFIQTGVATILGLNGTQATVRISIPALGSIILANLDSPTANIVLSSGGGVLLGNLIADNLLVIGATGSSNLFGSIHGVTTPAAAALGQIEPAVNGNYLFNTCVIGSPVCGAFAGRVGNFPPTATLLLPTLSIEDLNQVLSDTDPPTLQPNGSTTQNLQLYLAFPPTLPGDSNPEIVLPNVSGHDY